MLRKLTNKDVTFTVSLEPEETDLRGNAMVSGDEAEDKAFDDALIDRLDRGDTAAWCCLKVTACWDGPEEFEASTYLGGCSFAPWMNGSDTSKAAEQMAKDHEMYDDALRELNIKVSDHIHRAESIKKELIEPYRRRTDLDNK